MESTRNSSESLSSDVADSPLSPLEQPIQPSIGPTVAGDAVPSDRDRSYHPYGPSSSTTVGSPAAYQQIGNSDSSIERPHRSEDPDGAGTASYSCLHQCGHSVGSSVSSQAAELSTDAAVVASGPSGDTNQKNIHESVVKCKRFLSTLMKLASNQPKKVVQNIYNLIQGLIDGKVEPEDFTDQLQKMLKSSPQPYLVPFLRKSLPFLRHELFHDRMTIDGFLPPPASVAAAEPSLVNTAMVAPAVSVFGNASSAANLRSSSVIPNSPAVRPAQSKPLVPPMHNTNPAAVATPISDVAAVAAAPTTLDRTADGRTETATADVDLGSGKNLVGMTQPVALDTNVVVTSATTTSNDLLPQVNANIAVAQHKGEKRKYEATQDDDDISDVATMGGVNLVEESRNIFVSRQKSDKS